MRPREQFMCEDRIENPQTTTWPGGTGGRAASSLISPGFLFSWKGSPKARTVILRYSEGSYPLAATRRSFGVPQDDVCSKSEACVLGAAHAEYVPELKSRAGRPCNGACGGFTFTEILFALMILGIGFIMVAAMFPVAIRQTQQTVLET